MVYYLQMVGTDVDRKENQAMTEATTTDQVYTLDEETTRALIEDARQAEVDFLAALRATERDIARRYRLDLQPGQRIGNR